MPRLPSIIVVDIETTGLAPPDVPIEIGWTALHADVGAPGHYDIISHPASLLASPARDVTPESSAVHHLINSDVDRYPYWRERLSDFGQDFRNYAALAAHKASFERQWITPEFVGGIPWVCTYKCALRAWPDAPGHSNQVLRYWLKPAGLNRALADPSHRAGPDAYVTAFLLRELLVLQPLEVLIQWTNEPALLPRINFGKYRTMRWAEADTGYLQWVAKQDFDEDTLFTAKTELARRNG